MALIGGRFNEICGWVADDGDAAVFLYCFGDIVAEFAFYSCVADVGVAFVQSEAEHHPEVHEDGEAYVEEEVQDGGHAWVGDGDAETPDEDETDYREVGFAAPAESVPVLLELTHFVISSQLLFHWRWVGSPSK